MGLRDLCQQIHDIYKAYDVARLTTEMYLSDMIPAMKPSDAFAKMAHREIERVAIDELEGRITSILLTPYPPGIPLLIPGERFNKTIVDYLRFARDFNEALPGLRDRRARPGQARGGPFSPSAARLPGSLILRLLRGLRAQPLNLPAACAWLARKLRFRCTDVTFA
jgi:hypothetical protein